MNITLVTVWYDENSDLLYDLVRSVADVCSHVVAVDGAYALYPDARGRSSADQAEAITLAARQVNLGLTLYQPAEPWQGNEIEKRNFALSLANIAKPDWLLILDGDERLLTAPKLHEQLENTTETSAVVKHYFDDRSEGNCRKLYRAPVHIGSWHAEYIGAEGQSIQSDDKALWLDGVVVEHRKSRRSLERQAAADHYYKLRDEQKIESQ